MGADKPTRRRLPRADRGVETTLLLADGELPCVVTNLTASGARAWLPECDRVADGVTVTLRLPDRGDVRATVRRVVLNVADLAFV